MTLEIDIAKFRDLFTAMADEDFFPSETIKLNFEMAKCYLTEGRRLRGDCYETAIYLLTAHLVWSGHLITSGQSTVGIVTGASISKVSVSITPPPARSGWQFWLNTTPYGIQLWALLSIKAAGGWSVGGLPERNAFKKVNGVFF